VPGRYDITADSCTPLSQYLIPPGKGPGIYNRCPAAAGGQAPGSSKTYEVTITRRSGAAGDMSPAAPLRLVMVTS
jgi:hypothetical protein